MTDLEAFTKACIEALYFTDTGDDGQPSTDDELSEESLAKIRSECESFWNENGETILGCDELVKRGSGQYSVAAQAGHDFWFTRNGHGVGFWDGDWPEPQATILDAASKRFGPMDTYLGDNGQIWI